MIILKNQIFKVFHWSKKYDESLSFKVHSCKITKIVKGNDFLLLSQRGQEKILFNTGYSTATINNSLQIKEKYKNEKKRRSVWSRRNSVVHNNQGKFYQEALILRLDTPKE